MQSMVSTSKRSTSLKCGGWTRSRPGSIGLGIRSSKTSTDPDPPRLAYLPNTASERGAMDFDGSTRKRPVVSLRGKSKEEDAKELLRRARAEREARAAEKRRAQAAATVLRFYRQRYVPCPCTRRTMPVFVRARVTKKERAPAPRPPTDADDAPPPRCVTHPITNIQVGRRPRAGGAARRLRPQGLGPGQAPHAARRGGEAPPDARGHADGAAGAVPGAVL